MQIGHLRIVNLDLCTCARAPNAYVRFDHLPCQPLGRTSDHRDRDDLVFGESETAKTIAGISSAFGSSRRNLRMPLTQTKLGCVNPNQLLSLRLINGLKGPQILLRSIGHLLGLHVHSSSLPLGRTTLYSRLFSLPSGTSAMPSASRLYCASSK